MKSLAKQALFVFIVLSVISPLVSAEIYVDGGLSYRRINNVNASNQSDNIAITDIILGYQDRLNLRFGFGNAKDTINIQGRYRDASYSSFIGNNYSEWQIIGDFRKHLNKQWWLLFSGDIGIVNSNNNLNDLTRFAVGLQNGFRISQNLLLTQAVRLRSIDNEQAQEEASSIAYSLGAQYDLNGLFAAFVDYAVDEDYQEDLSIVNLGNDLTTINVGIILGLNEKSGLRLSYQTIDNGVTRDSVVTSDFVIRY